VLDWLTQHITPLSPTDSNTATTLCFMLAAAMVTGIAKSGFGGGIGILAVPLIANALSPDIAIGVMLPVLIAADLVAIIQHRKNRSTPHLNPALIGAVIGVGIGSTALLWVLSHSQHGPALLKQALGGTVGLLCLTMVGLQAYKALGGKVPNLPQTSRTAGIVGGIAGFTSTLAHAAGPVMTLYWLQAKLPKAKLIGTLVVFFLLVNTLKILPYIYPLKLINSHTLMGSLIMLPAVPLGAGIGWWMQKNIPEKPFMWAMYSGALLAGSRLLWQAFA